MTRRKGDIMTVSELIEKLKKCDPEAEVFFEYEQSNPLEGTPILGLLEIRYHDDIDTSTVVLRG